MNAKPLAIAVLFAAMLVVSACSSGGESPPAATPSPTSTSVAQPAASLPPATATATAAVASPATALTPTGATAATPNAPLAKNFTLPGGDGKSVSLESYRTSKNVVVVFHRGFW